MVVISPTSFPHSLSSGKVSPESTRTLRALSESSDDQGQPAAKRMLSPTREKELSLYKKTKRAISTKKYSVAKAEAEAEASTPIELISRGPDGRFVMDPSDMEPSVKSRRIEGFPFAEESDMYPEFRQSDEENEDPLVPTSVAALKAQLTPLSSSQESYLPPPAYSPRFQPRSLEGRLQATGQARPPAPRPFHHGQYYGYLSSSSPGEVEPPPFYMPEVGSPLSSVLSSPPLHSEGPFGHPTIPEENGENASNSTLPLTQTPTGGRSPEPWGRPEFPFGGLEAPTMMFPAQLHPCDVPESLQSKGCLPRGLPPGPLQVPAAYPGILSLEAPKGWVSKSPGRGPVPVPTATTASKWQDRPMQPLVGQGQLRHTSQGMGIPVLPYPEPAEPGALGLDTRWYEPQPRPRPSPRQVRRPEPSLHQVVLQPARLSPLTQSPLSSRTSSPELAARARPRPSLLQQAEVSEITLQPPAAASFSRKSTPPPAPSSRSGSPSFRPAMAFTTLATGYPSPPPGPPETLDVFSQMVSPRRTGDELLRPEGPPPLLPPSG